MSQGPQLAVTAETPPPRVGRRGVSSRWRASSRRRDAARGPAAGQPARARERVRRRLAAIAYLTLATLAGAPLVAAWTAEAAALAVIARRATDRGR